MVDGHVLSGMVRNRAIVVWFIKKSKPDALKARSGTLRGFRIKALSKYGHSACAGGLIVEA